MIAPELHACALYSDMFFKEKKKEFREKVELKAICNAVFDGFYTVDLGKKILSFSPGAEAFTGFKEAEVKGKRCLDFLTHDDGKANLFCTSECLLDEVLKNGKRTLPRKVFIRTSVGIPKEVLTAASPILDQKGKVEGAAVFFREVTNELKIEQLKSDFLSVVSHELRIPLATIKESISLLSDGVAGVVSEKQKNILDRVKGQIERLGTLVESLLDVSSIESGRFRVKIGKLDLAELVRSLVLFYQPTAHEKGIRLLAEVQDNLGAVIGDPDRVTQVISNLLNNAFKFTSSHGTVKICAKEHNESFVECSVIDTGSGIEADKLAKLFERFEQLGVGEEKRRGGAGLGLSISKKIIEDLGGSIWAESKPGEGSKFTFTLPIYNEDSQLRLDLSSSIREARLRHTDVALLKLGTCASEAELESLLSVINHTIRGPNDKAVKHKNDIFVILAQTDKRGVISVEERIKEKLEKLHISAKSLIEKFGIALYPADALTEDELLKKVDSNMISF